MALLPGLRRPVHGGIKRGGEKSKSKSKSKTFAFGESSQQNFVLLAI